MDEIGPEEWRGMTEDKRDRADKPERARDSGEGLSAPPRQLHLSARRKQEAVLRLLRGADLDLVSRETGGPIGASGSRLGLEGTLKEECAQTRLPQAGSRPSI